MGAEYLFERFDRNEIGGDEKFIRLRTHRIPLQVHYADPAGFSARLRAVHIDQRGVFAGVPVTMGQDQFWVVDGGLGYRLPQRYGLVALEVRNLFDKEFRFQDTDPGNPVVRPRRLVLLRFTVASQAPYLVVQ